MASKNLVSIEQAHQDTRMSERHIYRLVREGKLKKFKRGRNTFIDLDELKAYIKGELIEPDQSQEKLKNVSLWDLKYAQALKSFIKKKIEECTPDIIILSDRKGAEQFDYIGVLQDEYKGKTFFASYLDFLSDDELQKLISDKVILVSDDLFQHGRTYFKIKERIEKFGPKHVEYIVSAQNYDCVTKGMVKHPQVEPTFLLNKEGFREYTSMLSTTLFSLPIPLDNDHLQVTLKFEKLDISREYFISLIASYGAIHFPHQRDKSNTSFYELTLNHPVFFNTNDIDFPFPIEEMAICKLRLMITETEMYITPIVIPHLLIDRDDFNTNYEKTNPLLDKFLQPIRKTKMELQPKKLAQLIYEAIQLYLSSELSGNFIEEIQKHPQIKLKKVPQNVKREDLIRRYGIDLGNKWHDILEQTIYDALKKAPEENDIQESSTDINQVTPTRSFSDFSSHKLRRSIKKLRNIYRNEQTKEAPFAKLDYFQIKKLTDFDNATMSLMLDYAVDRPLLKPKNTIEDRGESGYLCKRTYEPTEYFGIQRELSDAFLDEDYNEHRISGLLPYIIHTVGKRWYGQKGNQYNVSPTLFYKLIVNLLHFAASTREPHYLTYVPYLYGPEPTISHYLGSDQGFSERLFLHEYTDIVDTYQYDKTNNSYSIIDKDALLKLYENYFEENEQHIIYGYLKILKRIWEEDNRTNKTLITLSAAHSLELVYLHAYKEIDIWASRFIKFLHYLKTQSPNISKEALKYHFERLSEVITEMRNKLDMYLNLEKTYDRLKDLFESDPELGILGKGILKKIELPIEYSEDSEYPLPHAEIAADIMNAYTQYLKLGMERVSAQGKVILSQDMLEKAQKALLNLLKNNTIDYRHIQKLHEYFQSTELDGRFVLLLERQYEMIVNALRRDDFLPSPSDPSDIGEPRSMPYKSIVSCYSSMPRKVHPYKAICCLELMKLPFDIEHRIDTSDSTMDITADTAKQQLVKDYETISQDLGITSYIKYDGENSFVIVTEDTDTMIELLTEILKKFGEKEYQYVIPSIGLDYAEAEKTYRGYYYSCNAIYAAIICKDRRFLSDAGQVLLSKNFFMHLPEHLQDKCEIFKTGIIINSEKEKTDVYRYVFE